ncbi:MAG: amidophosphoribosyltransferase [Deltaproteobacteria bacterium]|nr:amidophosphoribosyltransferase [Deltaproteobacteria bacterium]
MCGFIGLVSAGVRDVAPSIHLALSALQHRGQDSAGIATLSEQGSRFSFRRGLGAVATALSEADVRALPGVVGVGHVRYPTIGRGVLEDAQPFFYRQPGILMAHNGNITNYEELRLSLLERSIHLMSHCDVEPALCELADALMRARPAHHTTADLLEAFRELQRRVRGSYSLVAALRLDGEETLVVFRDPHGLRPAVLGRRSDGSFMAASESVALDALGFSRLDDPAPGEVVILRANREPERHALESREPAPCVFEYIYFARPDAVLGGRSVYEVRLALGRELAKRLADKGVTADVVFPVPDTARPAATAVAEQLGLPLREGFIKNRYSGRTFIMPDALTRETALRLKLNPIPAEIKDRRVLLVDDSIVRGATLARVVALLRDTGAREVHLAIHAPPVRNPCYYGIDMSTEEELFARKLDVDTEDVDALERAGAEALAVDSLTWLPVAAMDRAFPGPRCAACFDGHYPEPLDDSHRDAITRDRRSLRSV